MIRKLVFCISLCFHFYFRPRRLSSFSHIELDGAVRATKANLKMKRSSWMSEVFKRWKWEALGFDLIVRHSCSLYVAWLCDVIFLLALVFAFVFLFWSALFYSGMLNRKTQTLWARSVTAKNLFVALWKLQRNGNPKRNQHCSIMHAMKSLLNQEHRRYVENESGRADCMHDLRIIVCFLARRKGQS